MNPIKAILSSFTAKEPLSYEFVEKKLDEDLIQTATRIKEGKYAGLVFSTGPVTFTEEGETIKLNYKYMVEYLPEGVEVEDDISNIIGDIIMDVVSKENV